MTTPPKVTKKTIYIDPEEEITGVIDKVVSAKENVVALVIPKRASVFSSAVNLKLLKRAATQNGKRVVLITSDKTLLPLAGWVGLHTAANLNSKPFVPKAPDVNSQEEVAVDEAPIEVKQKTPAVAPLPIKKDAKPPVEDEIKVDKPTAVATATAAAAKSPKDKLKKLKVPDFGKFRMKLLIGLAVLLVLIGFMFWWYKIAPRAVVNITGETKSADLAFKFTANTETKKLDKEKSIVPAIEKEIKKTETETVDATGEKNNGNKASGTVTLRNCSRSDGSVEIPQGTLIIGEEVSFVIGEDVELDPSLFSGGGACLSDSQDVTVMAEDAGKKYNVKEDSYEVDGFSGVDAEGSEMTGGTDEIVKVVSKEDVEKGRNALEKKVFGADQELKSTLKSAGYVPLTETFQSEPGESFPSPKIDTVADKVVVTQTISYKMVGVKEDALKELIAEKAKSQSGFDDKVQSILDDGLVKAGFQIGSIDEINTDVNLSTKIVMGPEIDAGIVKGDVAGLKKSEAEGKLKALPGVNEVTITTKPFLNSTIPKDPAKIQINITGTDEQAKPQP